MWFAIFDYQQELLLENGLNYDDVGLLFYIQKNILCRVAGDDKMTLFKNFSYKQILGAIPLLGVGVKQLKNKISKLINLNLIYIKESYPGEVSIRLTKKAFEILTPRHSMELEVEEYFNLAGWKFISSGGNLFPTRDPIYISSNNLIYINKKDNIIDTTHAGETLSKIFEKYPHLKDEKINYLPKDFDLEEFFQRMSESKKFLEVNPRMTLSKIFENYDKFKAGFYKDLNLSFDLPSQKNKSFRQREYKESDLNLLFDDLDSINL